MSVRHWGEIPNISQATTPDLSADIEKAMSEFCLADYKSEETKPLIGSPIILQSPDPLVMYAISLHKYMNNMSEMIRSAASASRSDERPSEDSIQPVPLPPKVVLKHKRNCLNFIPKEETDFTLGKEVEIPELKEDVVNKVLRKSICILFAHLGYEATYESILDLLVDILKEFYKKICSKLETAVYDEKVHGSTEFPHAVERVLVETGLGGVIGIHDYYQTRVIKYVGVLQKRSQDLHNRYKNLLMSESSSNYNSLVEVKIEKEETDENPEVHLVDGVAFSSLETGYELLNTLEAEANMRSLSESDIGTFATESPGNNSSEPEYSPFSKRKKSNN